MRTWLLAASIAVAPATALAAPISTDLPTLRKEATIIVIGAAHYDPAMGWRVDADTVIKGGIKPGPISVRSAPSQSILLPDGERVVAMIDASGALRWVGRKVAGATIESGVLQVQGFFDFNAHLVTPGVVTLAQLKTALATGALSQTFDVALVFPDGHGGTKASSKHFGLVYDPIARAGVVAGFSGACLTLSAVFGMEWGEPEISFSDACPSTTNARALTVRGKPKGVDAAGVIQLEASPDGPLMSEAEYDTFVADPSIATYVTVLELKLADGSVWRWKVDGAIADPFGKEHAASGSSSSIETKNSATVATDTYSFVGASFTVTYAGATPLPIVRAVDAGQIASCSFARGKGATPCTIRHAPSIVVHK